MGKLLPQGTSCGNGLSNALANANGGARANTGARSVTKLWRRRHNAPVPAIASALG